MKVPAGGKPEKGTSERVGSEEEWHYNKHDIIRLPRGSLRREVLARWFRSHANKLENPKVQRLSDAHYRAWDSLLCVACKYDGVLPPIADIAFLLRKTESVASKLVNALIAAGLFTKTKRGIEPHQWDEWQYKSDVSTERVKRFRERQRNVSGNGVGTPSESETEDEEEDSEGKAPHGPSPEERSLPVAAREAQRVGGARLARSPVVEAMNEQLLELAKKKRMEVP